MSISFIRGRRPYDPRSDLHPLALEYPCDGLIAVNDKAAKTRFSRRLTKMPAIKRPLSGRLTSGVPSAARCWQARTAIS